jgi:hypothetical protein
MAARSNFPVELDLAATDSLMQILLLLPSVSTDSFPISWVHCHYCHWWIFQDPAAICENIFGNSNLGLFFQTVLFCHMVNHCQLCIRMLGLFALIQLAYYFQLLTTDIIIHYSIMGA